MSSVKEEWKMDDGKYKCPYCSRIYAKKGIMGHIWRSHGEGKNHNPLGDPIIKEIVRKKNTGKVGWSKGLTKETDDRVMNNSKAQIGKHHKQLSDETKKLMSKLMKERYSSGWEPVCGRCKKYDYESPIAGHIKVDGTWELAYCYYLDNLGVIWKRNTKRFGYIKPNGKRSTYQPDFYVEEWKSYIEVKGYETDLDRAKWNQFPDKLIIIRKDDIMKIKEDGLDGKAAVC